MTDVFTKIKPTEPLRLVKMKDKELKLEETEVSLTLGGVIRYT
jgi:hypothetical protein